MAASDRVDAPRRERKAMLRCCHGLDEIGWQAESAAAGWRVQDVVAHIGSVGQVLFPSVSLTILRSKDIERTNDVFVGQRRGWTSARTLAEYETWSGWMTTMVSGVARTPLARVRITMAEFGRFSAELVPSDAMHGPGEAEWLVAPRGNPRPDHAPAQVSRAAQVMELGRGPKPRRRPKSLVITQRSQFGVCPGELGSGNKAFVIRCRRSRRTPWGFVSSTTR